MSNDVHPLRGWLEIVTTALRREDLFLLNYLQPYSTGAYEYWEPGIALLREPAIVFLLLRELWSIGYPQAFGWEHPYPDSRHEKLDLAIYRQRPNERVHGCCPEYVIEVKIRRDNKLNDQNDQKQVWWDLLRLLRFDQVANRYLLLLTFGPVGAPLANNVDDLIKMRLGPNRHQYSRERLISEFISPDNPLQSYYFQHFDKVSEILSDEFDTRLTQNRLGRARVSLLEVFRRSATLTSSSLQADCGRTLTADEPLTDTE